MGSLLTIKEKRQKDRLITWVKDRSFVIGGLNLMGMQRKRLQYFRQKTGEARPGRVEIEL